MDIHDVRTLADAAEWLEGRPDDGLSDGHLLMLMQFWAAPDGALTKDAALACFRAALDGPDTSHRDAILRMAVAQQGEWPGLRRQ